MAVAAVLAGCLGADEEAQPVTGAPREIAAVVQRLGQATAERDFATVCDELFTAAARERAGGDDCERLTRSAAEGVARPRIEVKAIHVEGRRARVEVATRATGQAEVSEVLELRRERGEWRVEALAD
jgi:hypothetical protein